MGKDWAKGLTAATDARVARAAAAHRGLIYRRRVSPADDRRYRRLVEAEVIDWDATLAYVVGLIATDGCLYRDGRHIAFVSKDEDLMQTFLRCIRRTHLRYRKVTTSFGGWVFRVQVSHARLYRWLLSIGLTPRKSLTLGRVDVPSRFFFDLARGLIDGDGSIVTLVHTPTRARYPDYRYERLWTHFLSASRAHVAWVQDTLRGFGIEGRIDRIKRADRANAMYRLTCGKHSSLRLLPLLYADTSAPHLRRKRLVWEAYARRYGLCRRGDLNPQALAGGSP